MHDQLLNFVLPGIGMIAGLLAFVSSLWNRALVAEARNEMAAASTALLKEIAALESRIFDRINGTYVRAAECKLREDHVIEKLDGMSREIAHIKEDL